ncbi:MAG: GNAT family N-acetyltransferase [Muribaculaceae bacterium]|nr:GNAT family N-acetyltransferase [Muribaculaceae bacterium]
MRLVKLTPEHDLSQFDCGDNDLNEFLCDNALNFSEQRIANTFVLEENDEILAYFCLLNDKVSQEESSNNKWKKLKKEFPEGKQFSSYPAIKIGRFAVSSSCRGRNIGTDLMDMIKKMLNLNPNYSAFRYLTVDAYLSAIGFYEKNDFKLLSPQTINKETRLMFFDMMELG